MEDFVFLCRNALNITFKRVDDCSTYFYRRLESGNSRKFEARDRIMADALNEMVSIYPPAVLCPGVQMQPGDESAPDCHTQYFADTFFRHAENGTVRYGEYYRRHGQMCRQGPAQIDLAERTAELLAVLSDLDRSQSSSDPCIGNGMSSETCDLIK